MGLYPKNNEKPSKSLKWKLMMKCLFQKGWSSCIVKMGLKGKQEVSGAHREEDGQKAWFVTGRLCVRCHLMTGSPGAFKGNERGFPWWSGG